MTRRRFLALAGSAPLALAVSGPGSLREGYCLRGRVWPGPGRPVLERGVVLVRGERILAVEPEGADFQVPDWAQSIDISLKQGDRSPIVTLLPGLWDGHAHHCWSPEDRRRDYLLRGVTGMGDLAAPLDRIAGLALDQDARGRPSVRTGFAGPMLTAPGGYPIGSYGSAWGLEIDTPGAAAQAVERLAGLGARMLKLGFEPGVDGRTPMLAEPVARAAVDEAHRAGLVVRCHCQDAAGLERALAVGGGVDVIEHVPDRWSLPGGGFRPVYRGGLDAPEPGPELAGLIRRMADQGAAWCPTLEAGSKRTWLLRGMQAAVGLFADLGGRVVLGTDAGFLGIEPGMPVAEMRLLAGCGLCLEQVLGAATKNAAQACGFPGLGRLAPGCGADLLAVAGDPLADPAALEAPLSIMIRGRVVAGE